MAKSSASATTSESSQPTSKKIVVGDRIRTVRVPDDLWEAAQEAAKKNGETVSEVIRRALEQYVADNEDKPTKNSRKAP